MCLLDLSTDRKLDRYNTHVPVLPVHTRVIRMYSLEVLAIASLIFLVFIRKSFEHCRSSLGVGSVVNERIFRILACIFCHLDTKKVVLLTEPLKKKNRGQRPDLVVASIGQDNTPSVFFSDCSVKIWISKSGPYGPKSSFSQPNPLLESRPAD